jgi:glycosyltransferase involved in cell wall biosynthesis
MDAAKSTAAAELVSVIIPAYNAANFIAETLASAQMQTYGNLEIIVVDDGSTDNTASIVEGIAASDSRVCLIQQPNRGVAAARNLGIGHARGTFVAPLDADDIWHPEKIARQVAAMREAGPAVGMVYSWSLRIDESDRVLSRPTSVPHYAGDVYPLLVLYNFVGNGSTPMMRRDYVIEVGGYDASLRARGGEGCEDKMLYLTLAERYQVAYVPAFLVGYRMSAFNMSNNTQQMNRSNDLVLEAVRAHHAKLPRRLFRWSNSMTAFNLSRQNLRRGRLLASILHLARTLTLDPGFLFEPPFRSAVRALLRRLARKIAPNATPSVGACKFPHSPIEPTAVVPAHKVLFSRRRLAFLQALCRKRSAKHNGRQIDELRATVSII